MPRLGQPGRGICHEESGDCHSIGDLGSVSPFILLAAIAVEHGRMYVRESCPLGMGNSQNDEVGVQ